MAVAVHTVRRAGLTADLDAVVVGVGGIGTFITVAAAATGARVLVVDRDPARLDLAVRLGASETLLAGDATHGAPRAARDGARRSLRSQRQRSRLASVLDAARPAASSCRSASRRSRFPIDLGSWTLREYTIVGTVAHVLATDIPEAVRLLGTRDDWSDVAGQVIPLADVVASGLETARVGRVRRSRPLIDPWAAAPRRRSTEGPHEPHPDPRSRRRHD